MRGDAYDFGGENALYQGRHIGTRLGTLERMRQQLEHESMLWELLHLKLHRTR